MTARTTGRRRVARACVLALGLAAAGCGHRTVVRRVDGVAVEGPFVVPAAYAAYAAGAAAEARADEALVAGRSDEAASLRREAASSFRRALDRDAASAELWTRLARNLDADWRGALDRAEALDPSYAPLWCVRAERLAAEGELGAAVEAAERALALEPRDLELALGLARLWARAGHAERAFVLARELVLRFPERARAWQLVRELASASASAGWRVRAEDALARLERARGKPPHPAAGSVPAVAPADAWRTVDGALRAGDLAAARRASRTAHLPERLLAARALALGRGDLAGAQAARSLAADPSDAEARLVLVLALELGGERAGAAALLQAPAARAVEGALGSELVRLLWTELVRRHLGADIADNWLAATARLAPAPDPELPGDLRALLEARARPEGPL
ncbi:MAG: tetratricopeptide repeat protein [Polyangiaceae bacterium]|nr:tetratricopeptide repeat protein [Polyangiaceae bacterium]